MISLYFQFRSFKTLLFPLSELTIPSPSKKRKIKFSDNLNLGDKGIVWKWLFGRTERRISAKLSCKFGGKVGVYVAGGDCFGIRIDLNWV